jgi:cytochrome c-type biogenesis protein CcmH
VRTLSAAAILLIIALVLAAARPAWAVDPALMSDPVLQARYEVLIHELRCVQCENNSLADSDADIAADVRRQIRTMLAAGKTDEQIKGYLVSRYSEFILFRPTFSWRNAWLWALPVILLLIGVVIAVRVIRQRAALVDNEDGDISQT